MSLRRYLIDTHILIWAMEGDSRLSPKYRSIVADIGAIEHLPHHHRDPFDRMLIAQAMSEKLDMLTADRNFSLYDITIA